MVSLDAVDLDGCGSCSLLSQCPLWPYVDVLGTFFAFLGAFEVSPFQRYKL